MTTIAQAVQPKFDSLSQGLQAMIMEKNVAINSLQDLIRVLEEIVKEADE